jgi:mRNA-degrading endonuclease toxin of MazEF toxin-antitoxin module
MQDYTLTDICIAGQEKVDSRRRDRGDPLHVDRNSIMGREQAGARCVLAEPPKAFNRLGTPLVCPILPGEQTLPVKQALPFR